MILFGNTNTLQEVTEVIIKNRFTDKSDCNYIGKVEITPLTNVPYSGRLENENWIMAEKDISHGKPLSYINPERKI